MKRFFLDSKKIVVLILAIFLFPSCQKWLDIAPEKDLIKTEFWKTKEDVNSALAGTYSAFRDAALQSFIWGEARADMVKGFPGDYSYIEGSNILPTNSVVNWSKYYTTINLANTLMYFDNNVLAIDKSFTQKMKDAADAEALFIRSLSYFYLVRLWKNVPLVTNPAISDTCNIYPTVSNESKIVSQIIKDLLIAKDKAYTTEFQSNPVYFRGRANRYSILALLADVYLWNQQYQKCIDCCEEIRSSGLYNLLPSSKWFTMYNPGNSSESIFELQFRDDKTTDQINPMFNINSYSATVYQTLINLNTGSPAFTYTTKYNVLFPDITDIRACKSDPTKKYTAISIDLNLSRSFTTQRDAHFLYYRYADILLMEAEAYNELGDVNKAQTFVTQTAERAGNVPIAGIANQSDMRNVILDERAKEFVIEGKRWFDILRVAKRNHFANQQLVIDILSQKVDPLTIDIFNSKATDTMMYYLPVPYDELKRNKNLVQNSFYLR